GLGVGAGDLGRLGLGQLGAQPLVLALDVVVVGDAVPGVAHRAGDGVERTLHGLERGGRALAQVAHDRHVAQPEHDEGDRREDEDPGPGAGRGRDGHQYPVDEKSTLFSASNSSRDWPEPTATACSGLGATTIGMPVSWCSRASRPWSSAPPPARQMPLSMMSAASSGGVLSSVTLTASTMACTGSSMASRTSSVVVTMVLGRPVMRSRPRISAWSSSTSG